MPATALRHFEDDIARAGAIVRHAGPLPRTTPAEEVLRSDLLRSGWMFAVAALDAYFCDAYTDLVAHTASSKSRQPGIALPTWALDIKLPLRAILEEYDRTNWRWRMAARKMMERENVLSLAAVQTLFNKFFRTGRRFFTDLLDRWIPHPDASFRLFGTGGPDYASLSNADKSEARRKANTTLAERFEVVFQRRHDCIHNCDRPKQTPQKMNNPQAVLRVIDDIAFLVRRCDEHIDAEFREFLVGVGCSPATVATAGY